GVTLQRSLARCACEFAIVQMFEPAQPHTIDPHKAEHLPSEVALRIETARLLQDLYPTDVELLHPLADLRRQLTRQPDKRRYGRELILHSRQRLSQHLGQFWSHGV